MKVDIFNTENKYKIIYADPAWLYRDKAVAGGRGGWMPLYSNQIRGYKGSPCRKVSR